MLADPVTPWQRVTVPGWYGGGERVIEISTAVWRGRTRPSHERPLLLGLFSRVTLLGKQLTPQARSTVTTSAWYRKQRPTFSDTLAAVRREVWREQGFVTSATASDTRKLRPPLREGITCALCQAA